MPGLNETTLFVIEDGKAQSRVVQTGLRLERMVQITSGLNSGDVVITSGQMQLRAGTAVRPQSAPGESPSTGTDDES